MAEIGEFGASGAFWFWWMNYHSLMVFSMSEMVSSISSSVSLLSSILVNVRLKIVMRSSSLVIHEVNVFLTVRILVSYLDRRLLICFNIHFLMMYLIMVEFPQDIWCSISYLHHRWKGGEIWYIKYYREKIKIPPYPPNFCFFPGKVFWPNYFWIKKTNTQNIPI